MKRRRRKTGVGVGGVGGDDCDNNESYEKAYTLSIVLMALTIIVKPLIFCHSFILMIPL